VNHRLGQNGGQRAGVKEPFDLFDNRQGAMREFHPPDFSGLQPPAEFAKFQQTGVNPLHGHCVAAPAGRLFFLQALQLIRHIKKPAGNR